MGSQNSKACNGVTRSWVQIPPPPLVVVRGRSQTGRPRKTSHTLEVSPRALGERLDSIQVALVTGNPGHGFEGGLGVILRADRPAASSQSRIHPNPSRNRPKPETELSPLVNGQRMLVAGRRKGILQRDRQAATEAFEVRRLTGAPS